MLEESIEDITKWNTNFAPTFVDHHSLPDINFNGNCLKMFVPANILVSWFILMMSVNLRGIAILTIKASDYCCIINLISKIKTISLNAKFWFDWKKSNIIKYKNLFSYI